MKRYLCVVLLCVASVAHASNAVYDAQNRYVGRYSVNPYNKVTTFYDPQNRYVGRNDAPFNGRVQSYDALNRYRGSFGVTVPKQRELK